jgi:hypothetical protein
VKRKLSLVLSVAALASLSHAEARWCSITGLGEGQNLRYVPIARAARVSGVVLDRVIYLPNGTVQSFEPVSGPKMLVAGLESQMKEWTIKTNARGDEPCVSLVIADFKIDDAAGESKPKPVDVSTPSMLRLGVSGSTPCLCDPVGILGRPTLVARVRNAIRRGFGKIIGSQK